MLDSVTKRRIDTARDILVGKVPDPKSQVEQITLAMLYKFMDDMDAESEELGGKRKFFTGDFAKYGWAQIMSPRIGGHEMLGLYGEGISRMPENPGVPPLFRDIFKNAYLPYRDPETLKAFLKIIGEFSYDHSEKLGDAFEYLLSVLGSQGDAGQFRTPRHIIDFMVEVLAPQKGEVILDPACGTAGFLISAYKHIQRSNVDARGQSTLTPDDRARLAKSLIGYDISPDMVRLSLTNLYLHGFTDPHVHEYDTLTSDDRWNEHADVILANPPFMNPKGGIKPHQRFSIQAKRSEVLFVDYMAEHLTPTGRAAIIVPEGVVFQSQGAFVALRKLLLEQSLVAVVSLPAGCFNPYSAVKTSILILDKAAAKRSDSIAFFRVENDGFGLGAQRRAIRENDLPAVTAELAAFLAAIRAGRPTGDLEPTRGHVVRKSMIAEDGEYSLTEARYLGGAVSQGAWPMVPLGEITIRRSGGTPSKARPEFWTGDIPWVSPKDMKRAILHDTEDHVSLAAVQSSATSLVPRGTLLCVVRSGILKHSLPLALTAREMCFNQDIVAFTASDDRLDIRFLALMMNARRSEILADGIKPGVTVQSFYSGYFDELLLPLPPMEDQQNIVAEIERYQKVIDGARSVVENYRPHIPVGADWAMVELAELCKIGGAITTQVNGKRPSFGADSIESNTGKLLKTETAEAQGVRGPVYEFSGRRLLYSKIRPYLNKLAVVNLHGYCSSDMYPLEVDATKVEIDYLATYMLSEAFNESIRGHYERASIPKLNQSQLFGATVPLPSLTIQRDIVADIEAEKALVAANSDLIARFEKKIQTRLARIWGDTTAGGPAGSEVLEEALA